MHEAVAAERHDVGLRIAPTIQGLGPLSRTAEIEHGLTQGDHLAVRDPGEHRRQLVGGDGDHDFVEAGHALDDSSLLNQRIPTAEPRKHGRVGVREAPGDLLRLGEARVYVLIATEQSWQRVQHLQPGVLDGVVTALLHEPCAAGDPAHRRS
jgi:hypothetical protein